ncbi:MAG: hypothetical protein ACRETL_13260 [Gammaproteobacteria bacterium]
MIGSAFDDHQPPLTERVSAYDERHLATYIRLLDADAEGVELHITFTATCVLTTRPNRNVS